MSIKNRNPWLLLILLVIGIVIGGVIGDIFKDEISFLNYSKSIGFEPFTIDLSIIKFTLGLMINFNLASILGILLSILIFSRL